MIERTKEVEVARASLAEVEGARDRSVVALESLRADLEGIRTHLHDVEKELSYEKVLHDEAARAMIEHSNNRDVAEKTVEQFLSSLDEAKVDSSVMLTTAEWQLITVRSELDFVKDKLRSWVRLTPRGVIVRFFEVKEPLTS